MPRHSESTLSAIKSAVDIVTLVGESLPSLRRVGTRYKALCPFHQDHNPSLEVNPDRQSYKCWSCGAGGDIFDFVKNIHRVEFPEALRMLADRAGVVLESPSIVSQSRGPKTTDLLEVNAWAADRYRRSLAASAEVLAYVARRGLSPESIERFGLGHAPEERGWLLDQAHRDHVSTDALEAAGLVTRSPESPGLLRERFRGRLMFPIRDERGRVVGFGGRILPEVERAHAAAGREVAKYLNTPETSLFRKRTLLYGADLARLGTRQTGWVAVVEGYTDVIAAHQVGLTNVVATLGTALGDDHVRALRRLADRVVLVFDGDQAGQSAADRAVERILGSELLDVRVLTLPANLDPCDFVLREGAEAFRKLAAAAPEALAYLVSRASHRFELDSIEGSRRAAEWVLGVVNQIPDANQLGLGFKKAKVLDTLATKLRIDPETLNDLRRQLRRSPAAARKAQAAVPGGLHADQVPGAPPGQPPETAPPVSHIRQSELDRTDLELMQIILSEPTALSCLLPRVAVSSLRDEPLRVLLQACYDLQTDGLLPSFENLMIRLEDPAIRELAAGLVVPSALTQSDPGQFTNRVKPAPWKERLENMRVVLHERERQARLRDLKRSRDETDQHADPDAYRAINLEYQRLLTSGRTRKS